MDSMLSRLINARIEGIQPTHDYWQVITDKGGINIYNPIKYNTASNDCLDFANLQLCDILNHIIVNVETKESEYLRITLDNTASIVVSLADNDYVGPEAFDIYLDTGEIIVG